MFITLTTADIQGGRSSPLVGETQGGLRAGPRTHAHVHVEARTSSSVSGRRIALQRDHILEMRLPLHLHRGRQPHGGDLVLDGSCLPNYCRDPRYWLALGPVWQGSKSSEILL